jgi:hypothetical protein
MTAPELELLVASLFVSFIDTEAEEGMGHHYVFVGRNCEPRPFALLLQPTTFCLVVATHATERLRALIFSYYIMARAVWKSFDNFINTNRGVIFKEVMTSLSMSS